MNKISKHLSYGEVVCKCGCGFGLAPDEFSPKMASLFEYVRAYACLKLDVNDCPIEITSGCRCEKHNEEVGGAFDSYHKRGEAVDTHPPLGLSVDAWYDLVSEAVGDFGAVISYAGKNIVHFDCRGVGYRKDGHRG